MKMKSIQRFVLQLPNQWGKIQASPSLFFRLWALEQSLLLFHHCPIYSFHWTPQEVCKLGETCMCMHILAEEKLANVCYRYVYHNQNLQRAEWATLVYVHVSISLYPV